MRQLKWIFSLTTIFFFCSSLHAQQGDRTRTGAAGEEQPAGNATQNTADSATNAPANAQAATDTAGVDRGSASAETSGSNTPAVQQTTTSQSGSPAVMSGSKGSDRDGTNNVQRAGMNMAGAPAENLDLDDNTVDPDSEMKDRQSKSRDKQISTERSGEQEADAGEINDKSRRENNAASDQNLSAKDRKDSGAQRDDKEKSNKKSKRKKNKGKD